MRRRASLRFRIAVAYVVGSLVVSGTVAVGTYTLAWSTLTGQTRAAVEQETFNAIRFASEWAAEAPADRPIGELVSLLQNRVSGDVIVSGDGLDVPGASGVSLGSIPGDLREAVTDGAIAWKEYPGEPRRLAWGSQLRGTELDVYFVYGLDDLDATLDLLLRILAIMVAGAAAVAGVVGIRLANRTTRPLRAASEAARRVAEGHLETRLDASGGDELGQLAGSFNQMTEALEHRIERERRFVADASHELRTPLTALKTSVDLLAKRSADLPDRLASAAGLASREVRSLQRLVDDLLELTRAEAGGVHVEREEVDLVAFAREVSRRRAPDAGVTIEAPDELVVRTDKARLERVVGNLVENAVVHGAGREVTIALADGDNGTARISVIDAGEGIDAETLPHIFDRFWRGDQSRQRDGRVGAGLGLAIARENAALIGAVLEVESMVGEGTRFDVVLTKGEDG